MKELTFITDIIKGLYYDYPLCCILQYSILNYKGQYPAYRMWHKFKMSAYEEIEEAENYDYVQCDKCMVKYLKRIRK